MNDKIEGKPMQVVPVPQPGEFLFIGSMARRDLYAALAMQGMVARGLGFARIPEDAYALADALIAAGR